jgi:hypothetical protein
LYVGRFYNYDNIKELNNNEDLIKNVAQKFNDMERMLNDMSNLPNVITEFLSLYADANTANERMIQAFYQLHRQKHGNYYPM